MAESYIKKVSAGGGRSKINYTNAFTTTVLNYGPLTKQADATSLSQDSNSSGVAKTTDYVFFAGGNTNSGRSNSVDAYSTSLVKTTVTALPVAAADVGGGSVNNFAIFVGGFGASVSNQAVYYNNSLVRNTLTNLPIAIGRMKNADAGPNLTVFAGGGNSSFVPVNNVIAYDQNLTRTTNTLTHTSAQHCGASVSNFAIFGGLNDNTSPTFQQIVNSFNSSLTRSQLTNLPESLRTGTGVSFNSRALIGGGDISSNVYSYDESLTRTTLATLSGTGNRPGSASNPNFALFAGGGTRSAVDTYNTSFTRSTTTNLTVPLQLLTGQTINNFMLFAGGFTTTGNTNVSTVQVYTQQVTGTTYQLVTPTLSDFVITYNYDFNTIGTGTVGEGATLSSSTTFTGFLEIPEEVT
jgi:hypothetical protein